jgi:16S rRNA (guanine966-N2)-methyltransferase
MLEHRDAWHGRLVWDAYAGSGALGLEAWSRGAEQVVFTETNPTVFRVLQQNVKLCGLELHCTFRLPAEDWLAQFRGEQPLLVLVDPPYAAGEYEQLLPKLWSLPSVPNDSWFVVESPATMEIEWPAHAEILVSRRYGSSKLEIVAKCPPPAE